MSKNEEKELAKELARCLYEIKNKKKKVEDKGEPFFSDNLIITFFRSTRKTT